MSSRPKTWVHNLQWIVVHDHITSTRSKVWGKITKAWKHYNKMRPHMPSDFIGFWVNSMILKFAISHITNKCLCVIFNFHPRTMHVLKNKAYDDSNNVIKSIYQVPIIDDLGLKWMANVENFIIIVKNLSKSPQNIILMQKIMASIAKELPMLWKSSKKFSQTMSILNLHSQICAILLMRMEHYQTLSTHPNPCYTHVILLATHASSELKELNYDKFCIENVHCIPTSSNGDVLFEFPLVVNFDDQCG